MSTTPETTLAEFAERLGSSAPTPGGGAAAALVGALAAALAEMVGQLTVGRPRYAAVEERMRHIVGRLQAARAELLALIDTDAEAFQRVSAAYKLPKASDDERTARDMAIQTALRGAMEPPLRVMDAAADLMLLTDEVALIGNPTVASDAGCAAVLGEAAVRAGALNVLANVALLPDDEPTRLARARVTALEERAAALCAKTLATVHERMGLLPAPSTGAQP